MASKAVVEFFRKPWAFPLLIVLILAIVGFIVWQNVKPAHGTWRTGICRVFLEFEYTYPITFDYLAVTEDRSSSRIYFAEQNPFGNERIVQGDCEYQIDETRGAIKLVRMSMDRKAIPPDRLVTYNRMIPTLMSMDLNLEIPKPLPRSLDKLKR